MVEVREGYKMTELGEIPVEWEVKPISELFNIRNEVTSDIEKHPLYSLTIENGLIEKPEQYERSFLLKDKEENKYALVRPNDLVINPMNLRFGAIAKANVDKPVAVSAYYDVIFEKEAIAVSDFYIHLLSSSKMIYKYNAVSTGSLIEKRRVHLSQFVKLNVIYPPIQEQQKIAEILSSVDTQIEQTEKLIEKTKELKKGLMQQLLTKGIGHTEFKKTILGEVPTHWKLQKLEDITLKITDGAHKTPTYTETGIPFLRVVDIQGIQPDWKKTKYIPTEEHKELIKRCNPERGDILLSKNGTIGIVKIIDWDIEFSIFVSLCLIKLFKDDSKMSANYLSYYLASETAQKQFKDSSKKGTVTNLHLVEIKKLEVTIPPLEEQQKITEILSTVDAEIDFYEQEKAKYEELKKGLMQQLLTGEIRVKVDA